MRTENSQADSRNMGWLLAGLLALAFSSSAWALDFDKEISRQERTVVVVLTAEERAQLLSKKTEDDSSLSLRLVKTESNRKLR